MKDFFDTSLNEDSLEDIVEKHNITKLLEFERYFRDNNMYDRQEECYAQNSVVTISWYQGDGKEFVRRSARSAAKHKNAYFQPKHRINNTFIWLNKDKALAEMQCEMFNYHIVDGDLYDRGGYARLLYRVIKENGTWKIAGLDCIYEKDYLYPVYPNGKKIDSSEFENYRQSYQCMTYVFEQEGRPVKEDLPGDDRPDLVNKLYKEANAWLYEGEES